jgi:energy-coupling factor transporter ATP-binding protein EcfA2
MLDDLKPEHLGDLRRSGLSDEMIARMAVRSLGPEELTDNIYGARDGDRAPGSGGIEVDGYAIPYFGLDGSPMLSQGLPLERYRLMRGPDDSGPKYMAPVGSHHNLYIPPGLAALPSGPLFVTEGEKKAARMVEAGHRCVSIPGVWMWADPAQRPLDKTLRTKLTPETPVLPALLALADGAEVVLVADHDPKPSTQEDVQRAFRRLGEALLVQGACRAVRVGTCLVDDARVKPDHKWGLDDLLMLDESAALVQKVLAEAGGLRVPGRCFIPDHRADIDVDGEGPPKVPGYAVPYFSKSDPQSGTIVRWEYAYKERKLRPRGFLPYILPTASIRVVPVVQGVAATSGLLRFYDHFEGYIRGDRFQLQLTSDEAAEPKTWSRLGVPIKQGGLPQLLEFFNLARDHFGIENEFGVSHRGWFRLDADQEAPHYIFGDRCVSPPGARHVRVVGAQGGGAADPQGVVVAGTFEGWRQAAACVLRDVIPAATLGAAVGAALSNFIPEAEPFILHLVGPSGIGKTTLLQAVASLQGAPSKPGSTHGAASIIHAWRTTDNGLEALLASHNDNCLIMDEAHNAPATMDWSATVYMIGNGRGKQRLTKEGGERAVRAWTTTVLSSGEIGIISKVQAGAGRGTVKVPGGLLSRILEVSLETGGVWPQLEAEAQLADCGAYAPLLADLPPGVRQGGPALVIEALDRAFMTHHGHLWPRLIAWLQEPGRSDDVRQTFDGLRSQLESSLPPDPHPVQRRRTKHGALILSGLAVLMEVADLFDATTLDAVKAWVQEALLPGGLDASLGSEEEELAQQVFDVITANSGRFPPVGGMQPASPQASWGWTTETGEVFLNAVGQNALVAELQVDKPRLISALKRAGWASHQLRYPWAAEQRHAQKLRGLLSRPDTLAAKPREAAVRTPAAE